MSYPRMVRLKQQFARPRVEDIPKSVRETLSGLHLDKTIKPGQSVALTAGSRGIANIPVILRSVAHFLKDLGAAPFLVPAMGSHGGGTVEGQRQVLESYGITEAFVGAPIRASMDVVLLGSTPEGYPVVLDKIASQADHIGIVARIKPHTGFQGPIESGLMKMMMIGLGKHIGAASYHRILLEQPFDLVIRSVGRVIRSRAPIAFGLAVVENAYDETAHVEALLPANFETAEEKLLLKAREWMPRLPFQQADLLIIDEIGKDISGSGLDSNVIGRKRTFKTNPPENQPQIRFIFVRGLSSHTHGNAFGIGLADFTTTRLVRSMNYSATVINCLTSGHPENAFLPIHLDSDKQVIDAALAMNGTRPPEQARIMHIRNTLAMEEVEVSEACLSQSKRITDFRTIGEPRELTFDGEGNLAAV